MATLLSTLAMLLRITLSSEGCLMFSVGKISPERSGGPGARCSPWSRQQTYTQDRPKCFNSVPYFVLSILPKQSDGSHVGDSGRKTCDRAVKARSEDKLEDCLGFGKKRRVTEMRQSATRLTHTKSAKLLLRSNLQTSRDMTKQVWFTANVPVKW